MDFFESRAYEQSAPPPAAVSFHVIFFLCICGKIQGAGLHGCQIHGAKLWNWHVKIMVHHGMVHPYMFTRRMRGAKFKLIYL